ACFGTAGPGPGPVPSLAVRALTAADLTDSPAALVALTENWYAVSADRPVTVAEVPVGVVAFVPSRYTVYPVAPETAFQDRATEDVVVAPAARPPGAAGMTGPGSSPPPPSGPVTSKSSAK